MSKRSIPVLEIVITNFDEVAHFDDRETCAHLFTTLRLSRKRLLPKSVRYNGFRVTRHPNAVTVHLHLDELETARVSFVASPDFSRLLR